MRHDEHRVYSNLSGRLYRRAHSFTYRNKFEQINQEKIEKMFFFASYLGRNCDILGFKVVMAPHTPSAFNSYSSGKWNINI